MTDKKPIKKTKDKVKLTILDYILDLHGCLYNKEKVLKEKEENNVSTTVQLIQVSVILVVAIVLIQLKTGVFSFEKTEGDVKQEYTEEDVKQECVKRSYKELKKVAKHLKVEIEETPKSDYVDKKNDGKNDYYIIVNNYRLNSSRGRESQGVICITDGKDYIVKHNNEIMDQYQEIMMGYIMDEKLDADSASIAAIKHMLKYN